MNNMDPKRIVFIGNYLPRRCGIATFTTDLCETTAKEFPETTCVAVPVNDRKEGYAYPSRVYLEIEEGSVESYERTAEFLNTADVDLVCLQHEYGIYGGPAGSHVLPLLRGLRMPIVSTLHTVLRNPNPDQKRVLEEIAHLSDRVIVMSHRGHEHLQNIYRVPVEKIDFIPHGIPDVPFVDPNYYKDLFGVEGKTFLLTFGLLSANKGIENVIKALPAVLEDRPDVVYMVLGATHPKVTEHDGEVYRMGLVQLADDLGVSDHVRFENRFVGLDELVKVIGAADIYVTPYLNPEQSVSGTLAYTVGAGKAVISTPYWYAEELLGEGRGVLVPFDDSGSIAQQILFLLSHEAERHAMRKRAYQFGRGMIWSKVVHQYMESFAAARRSRTVAPQPVTHPSVGEKNPTEMPLLKLDHLRRLSDDTGILQHAIYTVPNRAEGYSTDDNARSLIVCARLGLEPDTLELGARYLAYLGDSYNAARGRFRNFLSYGRHWIEEAGSEDSHGRALWGLGTLIGRCREEGLVRYSVRLFHSALPTTLELKSPRAWAFTIFGLEEYLKTFPGNRAARRNLQELSARLLAGYRAVSAPDWVWFENILAYCNAALPHALLVAGDLLSNREMREAGLLSLQWLVGVQRAASGHFVPIGCNGFYPRGGLRARFDQQPVEAQATVSACLYAYKITGDLEWRKEAERAFDWYLGKNDLHVMIYDSATGGCRDGLGPDRLNQNEGAESTLSFLMSLLEMRPALGQIPAPPKPSEGLVLEKANL